MLEQKRTHLILPVESKMTIERISPGAGGIDSGKTIICKTLNVSRGGLSILLEEGLTTGTIMQIGVALADSGTTLNLQGEVRWCLPSEDVQQLWTAGFELLNAADSDIDKWVALLSQMER